MCVSIAQTTSQKRTPSISPSLPPPPGLLHTSMCESLSHMINAHWSRCKAAVLLAGVSGGVHLLRHPHLLLLLLLLLITGPGCSGLLLLEALRRRRRRRRELVLLPLPGLSPCRGRCCPVWLGHGPVRCDTALDESLGKRGGAKVWER